MRLFQVQIAPGRSDHLRQLVGSIGRMYLLCIATCPKMPSSLSVYAEEQMARWAPLLIYSSAASQGGGFLHSLIKAV